MFSDSRDLLFFPQWSAGQVENVTVKKTFAGTDQTT